MVRRNRSMFCLSQLDWTDLEKSWCQLCLQTHWRTCRGKRRRPQDCSSLRGSSPSSCKFLMELMISACISLITTHTTSVNRDRGEEWGRREGTGEKKQEKPHKRETEEDKKKSKGRSDRTPLLEDTSKENNGSSYPRQKHTLQNSWGSDIERNFSFYTWLNCSLIPHNWGNHKTH